MKQILLIIARIVLAIVFIFSGFVKVIDPLGSTYKFADYFHDAFSMDWMIPASFVLAIVMSAIEFLFGIALLINIRVKISSLGVLLFMIVFTPLTLYIAIADPVQDCGCFGDALIVTNWQTFYKNIIILIIAFIVFYFRKSYKPFLSIRKEWIITVILAILTFGLSIYCYKHLPLMDFRPYKVGTHIPDGMKMPDDAQVDEYMYNYVLKNTETGEDLEINSEEYVNDSIYWYEGSPWEFIDSSEPILIKKGYTPPIHDFSITSQDGYDITDIVLEDERFYFLLIAYDLNESSISKQEQINKLTNYCTNNNYGFICMTSSIDIHIKEFVDKTKAPYEFYSTDEITLKTIVRANPGLVLLKKGTILGKWHYNDIPEIEKFENDFFKKRK